MAKETYTVEHTPTNASITVEIDFDYTMQYGEVKKTMNDLIAEMADFWTSSAWRLQQNHGNVLNTFLKDLCKEIMIVATNGNYTTAGMISKFENREGYCKLDGTNGITLVALDQMELDEQDDFDITKIH